VLRRFFYCVHAKSWNIAAMKHPTTERLDKPKRSRIVYWLLCIPWLWAVGHPAFARGQEFGGPPAGTQIERKTEFKLTLKKFFVSYCNDCHSGGASEGGLSLDKLGADLSDTATFARWERIFDRVSDGEMPPKDEIQPTGVHRSEFNRILGASLKQAHATNKATVLRRLNRREYQNTLNDLFGTSLDLESMLPADARSHEFDNVGETLGVSMTHLQRYIEAAGIVFDDAVAKTTNAPEPRLIHCHYRESEVERALGKTVKRLDDGALVRFSANGLSGGHLREGGTPRPGKYRVRVTGYAYQTDKPVVVNVSGTSYKAGSEQPLLGFYAFPPGKAKTIEFVTWIDQKYMLRINPYGISDPDERKRTDVNTYKGPGFALLSATMEGPLVGEFPSRGHRLVFDGIQRIEIEPRNPNDKKKPWYKPKFEIESTDETADAKRSLNRVALYAFRRAVQDNDVLPYIELFSNERKKGESFESALRTAVVAILSSPSFLYLNEPSGLLDDFALANRLAYFLTRSAPDRTLLSLAYNKQLTQKPGVLHEQARRLMAGAKFHRFLTDFSDAWLNLREIDFTVPDRKLFPEYDAFLHDSIRKETEGFLKELIVSNLPVSNVVKSNFAMLNSRLASHYGIDSVDGVEIRKVPLPPDSGRGGFLSQASILKVTANGTNTSPVVRGVWVMERIFGETPPPPPPGIPGVEPDIRGASTLRELLDKHRNSSSCQSCHQNIDPPGFALEQFNPIGGFRERFRTTGAGEKVTATVRGRNAAYRLGAPVDASGQLATGESFAGFRELRDILAKDEARLARTLATKLLTFATGREMGFSDRAEIARIVKKSAEQQYRIQDLLHLVISSQIFKEK